MNITLLPLYNLPSFTYSTSLNNVACTLTFNYNFRSKYYYVTITLQDGTVVLDSKKVVSDYNIFSPEMYEVGINGCLYLAKLNDNVEENETTIKSWADNFLLGFFG